MNSENNPESKPTVVAHQKTKKLIRSRYYNVMVKVDGDVYHLDKFQLALTSDYFEKLFVEYSDQKECSLIELPVMDTDTFSTIVDIMYGQSLTSVLNHDNYVALLIAMDYLQVEIDLKTYTDFIDAKSSLDAKIFKLHNFVRENPNLQPLLPPVLKYLSDYLADMHSIEDFLHLPLNHNVQIVLYERSNLFRNDRLSKTGVSPDCELFRQAKRRKIAKSVISDSSTGKRMRKISHVCSKWICHDLESRLLQAAKLVNAAKRRFCQLNEINDQDFNSMLPGQIDLENMTNLFYKFLLCDGVVNPALEEFRFLEDVIKEVSSSSGSAEDKRRKFLENGYFHDMVVRVGEKTYKLHRFLLCPESKYFAKIFSTEQSNVRVTTQQSNKNEYLLGDIDQTTFDTIVKYVYFDELQLTCETITRVLKAANILKMDELFARCVRWMKANIQEVCAQVFMIDKCISSSWIRDNIEEIYSNVLIEPETSNTLPICLVSFDVLEDLLLSSSHSCYDPNKIVDICSKWVMHDVKNRYHLIPQIALAINRNRNHFEMDPSADLNDCSEQLIRDEIWKILRSTALVPSASANDVEKNVDETPVFVAMTAAKTLTLHVLNANLEQIASLCYSNSSLMYDFRESRYFCLAATLIDDNLFIMLSLDADCEWLVFYVYNLRLKKFISLNNRVDGKNVNWFDLNHQYSLLNCLGQVYCCFRGGYVFRYSIELNRWMIFSKQPVRPDGKNFTRGVWFTSDGDRLYRLYANGITNVLNSPQNLVHYVVDEFDFQQNAWSSLSDLSFNRGNNCVENLTIIDDKLTVILASGLRCMSFDRSLTTWREFSLTNHKLQDIYRSSFVLVQCEERLLHVFGYRLYEQTGRNQTWELIKELPLRMEYVPAEPFTPWINPGPYECISAIHKPTVRTD